MILLPIWGKLLRSWGNSRKEDNFMMRCDLRICQIFQDKTVNYSLKLLCFSETKLTQDYVYL